MAASVLGPGVRMFVVRMVMLRIALWRMVME